MSQPNLTIGKSIGSVRMDSIVDVLARQHLEFRYTVPFSPREIPALSSLDRHLPEKSLFDLIYLGPGYYGGHYLFAYRTPVTIILVIAQL